MSWLPSGPCHRLVTSVVPRSFRKIQSYKTRRRLKDVHRFHCFQTDEVQTVWINIRCPGSLNNPCPRAHYVGNDYYHHAGGMPPDL